MVLIATDLDQKNMYVCICKAVTDRQIRQAVELGATTLDDLKEGLGVATGCGKCAAFASALLEQELEAQIEHALVLAPRLVKEAHAAV
jgi:bacterioferritin-associated ferredoxin